MPSALIFPHSRLRTDWGIVALLYGKQVIVKFHFWQGEYIANHLALHQLTVKRMAIHALNFMAKKNTGDLQSLTWDEKPCEQISGA